MRWYRQKSLKPGQEKALSEPFPLCWEHFKGWRGPSIADYLVEDYRVSASTQACWPKCAVCMGPPKAFPNESLPKLPRIGVSNVDLVGTRKHAPEGKR